MTRNERLPLGGHPRTGLGNALRPDPFVATLRGLWADVIKVEHLGRQEALLGLAERRDLPVKERWMAETESRLYSINWTRWEPCDEVTSIDLETIRWRR